MEGNSSKTEEQKISEDLKQMTEELMIRFNLSSQEDNMKLIQKPFFYLSILEEMFGIDNILNNDTIKENFLSLEESDQLDFIIEFISTNIINDSLEHISGKEIVQGNNNHISELLQLLLLISETHINTNSQDVAVIPEEDSKLENFHTGNTKSDKKYYSQKSKIKKIQRKK